MDTPQVTAELLDSDWDCADAVLGLCDDGGFWAIGLRGVDPETVFSGIPMSTDRTGGAQLARLGALGLSIRLLPPLSDVDRPADVEKISYHYPALRISERYGEIICRRRRQPVDRVFDQLYQSGDGESRPGPGAHDRTGARANPLTLDTTRWRNAASASDEMIVARCEPPVVDLGCGPGRMVRALHRSGPGGPRHRHLLGGRRREPAGRRPGPPAPDPINDCPGRAAGARRCCSTATSGSAATCHASSDAVAIWWRPVA